MAGKIGAFAIIPNGPQINQAFSWYTYKQKKKKEKRKKKKALNVEHWTFERDEK